MQTTDDQGIQHRTCDVCLPSHTQEPDRKPLIPGSVRIAGEGEAEGNSKEHADLDPLTLAPRWALCPLDQHARAIDAWADHPPGVWIARCGHYLSTTTCLHDAPPGHCYPTCTRWSPMTEAGTGQ